MRLLWQGQRTREGKKATDWPTVAVAAIRATLPALKTGITFRRGFPRRGRSRFSDTVFGTFIQRVMIGFAKREQAAGNATTVG